ncbi:hypothetical protein O181_053281 [Austropuccinia psidii MF-1]|uniref:Uncharacterized protein n=1 Tax=Austropuccinia psidii MF-1 TaxID=1389203 RepID=A0A9Q3HQ24_9BASI|nr:hypothetical protein [Austropuccinia psidii MF-1]
MHDPPGTLSKTFGDFNLSITRSAINGVIHHYASFFNRNPIVPISDGYLSIQQVIKASCHPENSSRLKDKCYSQIPMTPSSSHWVFSLTVFLKGNTDSHSQGIFRRQFQNNYSSVSATSISLGNHMLSIQSGFIKTCIFNHTPWEVHPTQFFPNLARYTFHQTINTSSRIQYISAVSLKESSSQFFTYTSLP